MLVLLFKHRCLNSWAFSLLLWFSYPSQQGQPSSGSVGLAGLKPKQSFGAPKPSQPDPAQPSAGFPRGGMAKADSSQPAVLTCLVGVSLPTMICMIRFSHMKTSSWPAVVLLLWVRSVAGFWDWFCTSPVAQHTWDALHPLLTCTTELRALRGPARSGCRMHSGALSKWNEQGTEKELFIPLPSFSSLLSKRKWDNGLFGSLNCLLKFYAAATSTV